MIFKLKNLRSISFQSAAGTQKKKMTEHYSVSATQKCTACYVLFIPVLTSLTTILSANWLNSLCPCGHIRKPLRLSGDRMSAWRPADYLTLSSSSSPEMCVLVFRGSHSCQSPSFYQEWQRVDSHRFQRQHLRGVPPEEEERHQSPLVVDRGAT